MRFRFITSLFVVEVLLLSGCLDEVSVVRDYPESAKPSETAIPTINVIL
jgi:hypothetical protein